MLIILTQSIPDLGIPRTNMRPLPFSESISLVILSKDLKKLQIVLAYFFLERETLFAYR